MRADHRACVLRTRVPIRGAQNTDRQKRKGDVKTDGSEAARSGECPGPPGGWRSRGESPLERPEGARPHRRLDLRLLAPRSE